MTKLCITKDKPCENCAHYSYDVDFEDYYCSATPNDKGEVWWKAKHTCGDCIFLVVDEGEPYYCATKDLYTFYKRDDAACEYFLLGSELT